MRNFVCIFVCLPLNGCMARHDRQEAIHSPFGTRTPYTTAIVAVTSSFPFVCSVANARTENWKTFNGEIEMKFQRWILYFYLKSQYDIVKMCFSPTRQWLWMSCRGVLWFMNRACTLRRYINDAMGKRWSKVRRSKFCWHLTRAHTHAHQTGTHEPVRLYCVASCKHFMFFSYYFFCDIALFGSGGDDGAGSYTHTHIFMLSSAKIGRKRTNTQYEDEDESISDTCKKRKE